MRAAEFRQIACERLRGRWLTAVLVGLIAALLGGIASDGPGLTIQMGSSGVGMGVEFAGHTLFSVGGENSGGISALLTGGIAYTILVALFLALVYFVLGSVIGLGYARFNLELADGEYASAEQLFGYFSYWQTAAVARFLQSLFIFLWSLLLIVPGIVAVYSYAMTDYILAEYPDLTAREAIARSRELMRGNRWRLFCLNLSFLGWDILSIVTLGIGNLWLRPYKQTANAVFYREISGRSYGSFGCI